MNYHWNWGIFGEQVKGGEETYLDWLATGLGWTLAVSLAAWLLALVIGIAVGALRTAPSRPIALLGSAWVELFRRPARITLDELAPDPDLIVTCLPVLQEVLQGFDDPSAYRIAREAMFALPIVESPLSAKLVEEAVELRRAGIGGRVLLLSEPVVEAFPVVVHHHLTPVVTSSAGIEAADSWVTDGHKWLQVPYDSGFAIVRDREAHQRRERCADEGGAHHRGDGLARGRGEVGRVGVMREVLLVELREQSRG